MKIKKRKVSINSAFKSKKKRKNDNLSDEELNDVNSFNKELAEIAKRDPELYEFLKKEEADIFDKEKEDYDDVEEVEHEDVEEEDDFEDDDLDDEEGEDMDSEAGESLDSKEDATLDSEENESTDSEEDMDDEEDDKHVEDPLDAQTSDNEASVVDDQSIVPVKRDHETVVSSELLDFLEAVLHDPSSVDKATFQQAVETTVKAFISCVARVGDVYSKLTDGQSDFVIYDEQIFDRVLCLCFKSMGKSLYKLLNPAKGNIKSRQKYKKYNHFKNWRRYRPIAKCYLEAIHIFLLELNSNKVIVEAIRALADLVDIFIHFPKLSKNIIKCLVRIWSQQQIEEARCISFAVLCKISRMEKSFFPKIYKNCYVAYISNCKLINEETLPFINLMKASFIEFTLMYPKLSYQYAFVYIRQFAIHLRNAMIAKRRDLIQRVYNWQFLKGLKLWASLISEGTHRSALSDGKEQAISSEKNDRNSWFKELIYPIVEIVLIMGRIFPSSKYLPLRIHCLRILLNLQEYCNIYVPTLAFAFELLDDLAQIDVKKPKSGKGTTKGVSLEQILRLSNDQLEDAGVRQHLAQQLFLSSEQALKLLKLRERCPETLLIPLQGKLKRFLKKCPNREHVHLFIKLKEQMAEN